LLVLLGNVQFRCQVGNRFSVLPDPRIFHQRFRAVRIACQAVLRLTQELELVRQFIFFQVIAVQLGGVFLQCPFNGQLLFLIRFALTLNRLLFLLQRQNLLLDTALRVKGSLFFLLNRLEVFLIALQAAQ